MIQKIFSVGLLQLSTELFVFIVMLERPAEVSKISQHWSHMVTLREKCPNTGFFLVHIFLYSDWIRVVCDKWQQVTTNDNEWYIEWKRVTQRMKANESDFRFQNETIMQQQRLFEDIMENITSIEAATGGVLSKKLLLKISQYLRENIWRPETLLKRDPNTSVFLWILRNF